MHFVSHFAYLDAGTGSLIIQSIVGLAAGVAVFGRRLLAGTKSKFASLFGKKETAKPATKD
jgi:hypothetical protein